MTRKILHSVWLLLLSLMGLKDVAAAPGLEAYAREREQMVARQLKARDITDPRVLAAMGTVPRHKFVPEHLASLAYNDHPLPVRMIWHGSGIRWLSPINMSDIGYTEWEETSGGPTGWFVRGAWWLCIWPRPSEDLDESMRLYYTAVAPAARGRRRGSGAVAG